MKAGEKEDYIILSDVCLDQSLPEQLIEKTEHGRLVLVYNLKSMIHICKMQIFHLVCYPWKSFPWKQHRILLLNILINFFAVNYINSINFCYDDSSFHSSHYHQPFSPLRKLIPLKQANEAHIMI